MEGGITNDDLVQHVENDEISNGVETTDLADDRIQYPKSTSNSNQIDLCQSLSQVSLEDQERLSQEVEPESKKIKLDPVQPPPNMLPSLRYKELVCDQCGATIKGGNQNLRDIKKTLVQTNLAFQN